MHSFQAVKSPLVNGRALVFALVIAGVLLGVSGCASPQVAPGAASAAEERRIRQEIAAIRGGRHGALPPAQVVAANRNARVSSMQIRNGTAFTLTVLYAGPSSRRVVVPPQGTQSLALAIGEYQVAASVNAPGVIPYAGVDRLFGGSYENHFYISAQ